MDRSTGKTVSMIAAAFICLFIALPPASAGAGGLNDSSVVVMFWNLENFFDFKDEGGGESDREFSPSGTRHWTAGRFYAKCRAVAKSVFWIAGRYGKLPDIIGLAEVENRSVLTRLLSSTSLRKCGYEIIHRDSPDHRGIDVALLWRKTTMSLTDCGFRRIDSLDTREILYARMKPLKGSADISFAVNHFPSKYGGSETGAKRRTVAENLKQLCDSLLGAGSDRVIAMGDFNDESSSPAFDPLRNALFNAEVTLSGPPPGTIRFEGRWEQIDMFWSTSAFLENEKLETVRIPFLMALDTVFSGDKPLRTYSGPRYLGGVSDHCPILLNTDAL